MSGLSTPTADEIIDQAQPLEGALEQAFDEVYQDGEYLKARCCGSECRYKSGLLGTDMAECRVCGSRVVNLLSPHVSPLLIGGSATHMPTAELVTTLAGREWWVVTT